MSNPFSFLLDWAPALWAGFQITVWVTLVTMLLGTLLGLVLGLTRARGPAWARIPVIGFVEIFRGMPVIVVLFILYFGFPTIGVTLTKDPVVAGIVGLSLVLAAYLSEVFRAAIGAVDGGQLEAAHSLGMSGVKAYRRVVLPQALRIATPTVGGYLIQLFKDTSLLGFIGVTELMRKGQVIVSTTFRAFEVYITIGIIYLVVSVLAAFLIRRLEAKLTPGDARSKKTSSMNTGRGSMQLKVEL